MKLLKNSEVIQKRNDVFNYAHKYYDFNLEEDGYLNSLIRKMFNIFKEKIEVQGDLNILVDPNVDILKLRYTDEDIKDFNSFYLQCMHFNSEFNIVVDNDNYYINKFGKIILSTNAEYNNLNVLEFDNPEFLVVKREMKQNILASRIYQLLAVMIKDELGVNAFNIFNLANNHIISYEKTLLEKMKALELKDNLVRILK